MDDFDWRVSIASIVQAGPFSAFVGVDRVIMLLDGDGVQLRATQAGIEHRLATPHVPFAFSGDVLMDCALLGGPSTDFNVMSQRRKWRAQLRVLSSADTFAVCERGLLMALQGTWQFENSDGAVCCAAGQGLWWDGEPQAWKVAPQGNPAVMVSVMVSEVLG